MLLTPDESRSDRENGSDGGVRHAIGVTTLFVVGENSCVVDCGDRHSSEQRLSGAIAGLLMVGLIVELPVVECGAI